MDADRQHPVKKNRPIASGKLPIPAAYVAGAILSLLAVALVYLPAWQFALVMPEKLEKVTWALREAGSKQVLTTIVT